jgi:hypothetical protein
VSSDVTILETPEGMELSLEVKARSLGVSLWDNDDYRVVWFDMTSPEHRAALQGMVGVLQQQLGLHSSQEGGQSNE